jgi:hypothetical protein
VFSAAHLRQPKSQFFPLSQLKIAQIVGVHCKMTGAIVLIVAIFWLRNQKAKHLKLKVIYPWFGWLRAQTRDNFI